MGRRHASDRVSAASRRAGGYGNFPSLSEAHPRRYPAEIDFRFSHRIALGIDDTACTNAALKGSSGKHVIVRRID
jgi:hypothetical protein